MDLKKTAIRGLCVFMVCVLALGMLSGCASETGGGKLVKIAICVSNTTPASQAMEQVFKPMVEEGTEGRYSIQLYPAGVLCAEKVTYDYTRAGIVELCVVGTSMWS